jgi:polyhydroxyalkanoate synthesis regulator phasin
MSDPKTESRERKCFAEGFERLWGQALVAVDQAEEEAGKAVQRIADAAGAGQEEIRRHVRELSERLVRQRKDLEHALDDGVRHTLSRLRVPRREELQDIQTRLDRVAARIDALARR